MRQQEEQKWGSGVAYFDPPEKRRSDKAPDYTGFITLAMDYKAGEKVKFGVWLKEDRKSTRLNSVTARSRMPSSA